MAPDAENDRNNSFDYCFNYFRSHLPASGAGTIASGTKRQLSCSHLGFYLASWGMLRGSSSLSRQSAKHYEPVIDFIATAPAELWATDVDTYSPKSIDLILCCDRKLRIALGGKASQILTTKISLGVFGCVPAFDTYFTQGSDFKTLNRSTLERLARFYKENDAEINSIQIPTRDFETGQPTTYFYTKAEVMDMAFFVGGSK